MISKLMNEHDLINVGDQIKIADVYLAYFLDRYLLALVGSFKNLALSSFPYN